MTRFSPARLMALLAAAFALFAAGVPASATLAELTRHLESTRTMTADFSQAAADGSVTTGTLYLQRPGKIRFQYQKGVPLLVVSNGKSLDVVDYEVRQVQKYPIGETPLSVLLDPKADLGKFAEVKSSTKDALIVEARDRKHPEYGIITIYLRRKASAPGGLSLAGWNVVDSQGNTTRVTLSDVKFNTALPKNVFRYKDPRAGSGRPGR